MKALEYITDESGNKKALIIPIREFEDIIEDIEDIITAYQRKDEKKVSIEEVKKNLQSKGIL
ncbi:MAG: hypothetical protein ACLFPE_04935 [Bacteroidales bacterium]